jgi:flagellar basal-body rod protein FlgG
MAGLVEAATAIMSGAERRLETIANNIANVSTPGFKRQMSFSEALSGARAGGAAGLPSLSQRTDLTQGRMSSTGNPLDLAIGGPGFFQLRAGDKIVYSRQGQFRLAGDGTVVNAQGYVLQQAGGGDLVLERASVEILADGNVIDGGRPVGRIAVVAPGPDSKPAALGGSVFELPGGGEEVAAPELRQGMVEASNVSMGDEMTGMMGTLRQAEVGARLVQVYDDLLGRAISSFGQGGGR